MPVLPVSPGVPSCVPHLGLLAAATDVSHIFPQARSPRCPSFSVESSPLPPPSTFPPRATQRACRPVCPPPSSLRRRCRHGTDLLMASPATPFLLPVRCFPEPDPPSIKNLKQDSRTLVLLTTPYLDGLSLFQRRKEDTETVKDQSAVPTVCFLSWRPPALLRPPSCSQRPRSPLVRPARHQPNTSSGNSSRRTRHSWHFVAFQVPFEPSRGVFIPGYTVRSRCIYSPLFSWVSKGASNAG